MVTQPPQHLAERSPLTLGQRMSVLIIHDEVLHDRPQSVGWARQPLIGARGQRPWTLHMHIGIKPYT